MSEGGASLPPQQTDPGLGRSHGAVPRHPEVHSKAGVKVQQEPQTPMP